MCNHYRQAILQGATIPGWSRDQFSEIKVPLRFHNQPIDVYPDREGLVVTLQDNEPVVEQMRWGFPPPAFSKPPKEVTNLRHPEKAYWKPWLGVEHRCIVPATSFAEPDPEKPYPRAERWFQRANGETMLLAGIWRPFDGDRGPKKAPVPGPHRVYTILTTTPNAVVAPIHPKAMLVILDPADADTWLNAPTDEALKLQRPLPDDQLIVLPQEPRP